MKRPFRETFMDALADSGRSLRDVAISAGVSYEQLKNLKQGKSGSTNVDDAIALAAELQFSLDDGAPLRRPPVAAEPGAAMVDVYDVQASAGGGAVVDSEYVVARLSFPPDFLSRLMRTPARHLAIISVKGESMAPTLQDDDLVMLDTTKTSLDWDGLFVLRWGDALHVKRVGRSAGGAVRIISDNPAYPPIEIPRAEVEVIGRVIWMGKKV